MLKLRDTKAGIDHYPPTRNDAQRMIDVLKLEHYELWNKNELLEYGSTPTRISRQNGAAQK